MRRLTMALNVTLDGCCDHRQVVADDEHHAFAARQILECDALLFGGVSYRLLADFWPHLRQRVGSPPPAMDHLARALDSKTKYVLSRSERLLRWGNSVLLDELADVQALKRQGDGELRLLGSPGLGLELARAGLVDQLELSLQPLVAGGGRRLLEGLEGQALVLERERALRSGVRVLTYAVKRRSAEATAPAR